MDFDSNAFDILFDNCANRTVSPVKSNFYYLEEYDCDLTGIGTAQIKGVGTLHWQINSDEGRISHRRGCSLLPQHAVPNSLSDPMGQAMYILT